MNRIVRTAAALLFAAGMCGCSSASDAPSSQISSQFLADVDSLLENSGVSLQTDSEPADPAGSNTTSIHTAGEMSISAIEIGKLDHPPMRYQDQGWVVRQDGKYGYITRDGEWVVQPRYANLEFTGVSSKDYLHSAILYDFDKGLSQPGNGAMMPDSFIPRDSGYGVGGVFVPYVFVLDDKMQVHGVMNEAASSTARITEPGYAIGVYKESVKDEERAESEYWIWNPKTDSVYGPYAPDDAPCFVLEADRFDEQKSGIRILVNPQNPSAGEIFRIPEGSLSGLVSVSSGKTVSGFDSVDNIEIGVSGGRRNGRYEVYGSGLDLLYSTTFDAGAAPIGDRVPVKSGDTWVIASLDEIRNGASSIAKLEPAGDRTGQELEKLKAKQIGGYKTEADMNTRKTPDYDGEKTDLIKEGSRIEVTEMQEGSNSSMWGKIGEDKWICLYDADTLYCTISS